MKGTNGGSWYAVPARIKPERGQVPEYSLKPPVKQSCRVFHKHVSGSKLANQAGEVLPQPRAVTADACTGTSD
jgi:hypothetical protein